WSARLGREDEAVYPAWEDPGGMALVLWFFSMAWRHGDRYRQRPEWFEPSMAEMIEAGWRYSSEEIGRAWVGRSTFYEQALAFMHRYLALLMTQLHMLLCQH